MSNIQEKLNDDDKRWILGSASDWHSSETNDDIECPSFEY